jgi:hypothetical protein
VFLQKPISTFKLPEKQRNLDPFNLANGTGLDLE